jgi:hypothetical protein
LELKEQTETDRLPRVKEKRNYKRFELIPFLAILGCVGMILFECVFIFELYDRAVEQPQRPASIPVPAVPVAIPAPVEAPAVPAAPAAEVPPAQIDSAPAAVPVG